jgi:D-sedoheptulose 7-phosphate isomerase
MNLLTRIDDHLQAALEVHRAASVLREPLQRAGQLLYGCLREGGKILSCGNGGSAADAQHFAAELVNRFEVERRGLAAIALTTDTSILTSIANDYAYERVFARQIEAIGRPADVLLAISTSGHSPNVVTAVEVARAQGMRVVALTGRDGGPLAARLGADDVELRAPSQHTPRIQEIHLLAIHCLCDAIDQLVLEEA